MYGLDHAMMVVTESSDDGENDLEPEQRLGNVGNVFSVYP
jgi:hypothetical protein